MKEKNTPLTKREAIREKRRQAQRRKRLVVVLIIIGIALLVTALLISPTLDFLNPQDEIIQITPIVRPMVNGKSMGDPNAPVAVDVYSDFQCSACKIFAETIEPSLAENYIATGQVFYTYRQYPILDERVSTNESKQAANASLCAAEQDRFWDYHDILFTNFIGVNVGGFNDRRLIAFAEALGLDMETFESCFSENRYRSVTDNDIASGREKSVTGTPSVFVNGEIITPGFVPSYQDLREAIESALLLPEQ
jgi:protein-disulfide isomerase